MKKHKHKWEIEPRGAKTKYYNCIFCGLKVIATSTKKADRLSKSSIMEGDKPK